MAKSRLVKVGLILASVVLFLFSISFFALDKDSERTTLRLRSDQAIIYYNEACGMCAEYIKDDLPAMLEKQGITDIVKKDYVNERSNRKEMNKIMEDRKVPLGMQSHIMTFVGDKYILGGHIPENMINDLFSAKNSNKFKSIMVYQDEMHAEAIDYKVLGMPNYSDAWAGEVKTYQITDSVTEYMDYMNNNRLKSFNNKEFLLPLVLVTGFLDGINPCAFAVLLFFISFLFTLKRTKKDIWKTGAVYIAAIYLAYISIGFGLVGAVMLIDEPHAMAKIGAWLVIILGVINIIGLFVPSFPIKLRIPHVAKGTIKEYVHNATLPSAFILGFFVGLCTFPCSGGVYVAIIGLLVSQTTYATGVAYLVLYNIMFVMPLVIILFAVSNKRALEIFSKYEQSKVPHIKIMGAAVMIMLGIMILVWFT